MATNCLDIMELGLSECGDWERAAKVDGGCFRTTMDVDVEGFKRFLRVRFYHLLSLGKRFLL